MGRSVNYVLDAEAVVYLHHNIIESWEWDSFIECLREVLQESFPSLEPDDTWIGRELRSVLENCHARIVVSDYCGVASVSLAENDRYDEYDWRSLSGAWCGQVAAKFRRILHERFPEWAMVKLGTMSNGVSVYQSIG
jgi:hypothetical protein